MARHTHSSTHHAITWPESARGTIRDNIRRFHFESRPIVVLRVRHRWNKGARERYHTLPERVFRSTEPQRESSGLAGNARITEALARALCRQSNSLPHPGAYAAFHGKSRPWPRHEGKRLQADERDVGRLRKVRACRSRGAADSANRTIGIAPHSGGVVVVQNTATLCHRHVKPATKAPRREAITCSTPTFNYAPCPDGPPGMTCRAIMERDRDGRPCQLTRLPCTKRARPSAIALRFALACQRSGKDRYRRRCFNASSAGIRSQQHPLVQSRACAARQRRDRHPISQGEMWRPIPMSLTRPPTSSPQIRASGPSPDKCQAP